MYDVVIVGYGPVGQLAALLLGRQGHRVAVYERRTTPFPLPRAVHVDDEVLRVLQSAGLAEPATAIMDAPITYEWHNAAGEVLLAFDLTGTGPHGFPASNMFCQPELEAILDEAVRALPNVEVHLGVEVAGLADRADGTDHVALSTVDGAEVGARYVVGCDGANSTVRGHLAPTVTDLGFEHDWLVVDVVPTEPRRWDPPALQVCDPARPTTAVPGGPGRRRFEFMALPGESRSHLEDADTVWALLAPWGLDPSNCAVQRRAVYTFRAGWADRWRRGRVLLAGDAAHQMPPFAGQGLSAGVRDVANLAWKLDLVLTGRAGAAILDTYTTERIEHLRVAATISVELGKVICVLDEAAAAARDAGLLAARADGGQAIAPPAALPLGPGLTRAGDPLAGHAFPQGQVDGGRRFDDCVPARATLVTLGPDERRSVPGGTGTETGSEVATVCLAELGDADGTYRRWFAGHGRAAVLVRPDRHIFGSASAPEEIATLVGEWGSALGGP